MTFLKVGRANRSGVTSESSQHVPPTLREREKKREVKPSTTLPATPRDQGCQRSASTPGWLRQELKICPRVGPCRPRLSEGETNACRADLASTLGPACTCALREVADVHQASLSAAPQESALATPGEALRGPAPTFGPPAGKARPAQSALGSDRHDPGSGTSGAPRVRRTSVPAHTVSPRDPPWAVPIPERASVGPESQTRRNSRHAARARSGGRGLGEARPRRGDREVSAGTASAPRVLARVCRLRSRSRDYPFLPLFCVCAWGSNWCVRLEGGASLET